MERPKVTDAEVILDTGAEPFFTNGVWNATTRRVEFKGGFYEAKYRYAPYNPPYYAMWALPTQRQESIFGAVILEGEPLAEYCAWEASLDDALKTRWLAALDEIAAKQDAAAAFGVMAELAKEHPLPFPIARWIADKAAQPLPEGIRDPSKSSSGKSGETTDGGSPTSNGVTESSTSVPSAAATSEANARAR
jgi:hypothetical protein